MATNATAARSAAADAADGRNRVFLIDGPSLVYRGRRLQLNQAWPAYLPLLGEWAGRFTEGALLYPESRMPKGDALPPTMD